MKILRLGILALTMLAAGPLRADDDDDDHDLARRLVTEGQIRSLSAIVDDVRAKVPGEMLEVEFSSENGAYKYEMKILRPDGKVQEIEIDARDGTILQVGDDD